LGSSYERESRAAVEAARAAAELIVRASASLDAETILEKGSHDLVTEFDHAAQEIIAERLLGEFPDHHLLGEEGEPRPAPSDSAAFRWIVDPIDGTTNFTRGLPPFSISIALEHAGTVVVGVVLDPTRDELFVARRGQGLWMNGRRARCSGTRTLDTALIATGFPYRAVRHLPAFLEVLGEVIQRTHGFRRIGSAAVDLAYVAVGRLDAFYETGLEAWDMAAGKLLVEEGGGRVTDLGGSAHVLTRQEILASNGFVHDELVALMGPLLRSRD